MKGSRDRSSGRAAAVASTPGSRAQAPVDDGFLGLRHKTSWRTAVEDTKSWRHGRRSRDWRRNGRRRRLGPRCGRGGDGRRAASRAVRRPRRERRPGPPRGGGNLPARGVLAVFSKPATYSGFADPPKSRTGSSSPQRHRGEDFDSKKEPWPSDETLYLFRFCPYGPSSLISALRGILVFRGRLGG